MKRRTTEIKQQLRAEVQRLRLAGDQAVLDRENERRRQEGLPPWSATSDTLSLKIPLRTDGQS